MYPNRLERQGCYFVKSPGAKYLSPNGIGLTSDTPGEIANRITGITGKIMISPLKISQRPLNVNFTIVNIPQGVNFTTINIRRKFNYFLIHT